VIEAQLRGPKGELPGAAEFLRRFGDRRQPRSVNYLFDREADAREALGLLQNNKIAGKHFYRNELEREEIASQAGLFFGIHVGSEPLLIGDEVDATQMGELDLAADYSTYAVVASSKAQRTIARHTQGIEWTPLRGSPGYFRVEGVPQLSGAIFLPHAVERGMNENSSVVWARSDGRYIIGAEDARVLKDVGLGTFRKLRIGFETVGSNAYTVASGTLVDACLREGLRGLLQPVTPLLLESHPLANAPPLL
jgi:hypothetical protein